MNILSLGAGVQSSTILMMSLLGELPKLDAAIFADTCWEPEAVYKHLGWLASQCAIKGVPLLTVSVGNLRNDVIHYQRTHIKSSSGVYAALPLFIVNPNGTMGMIRRQCTERYKIRPISKIVRKLCGLKSGARVEAGKILCQQWLGISWDERERMKDPIYAWIENVYPLIDAHITRQGCKEWWKKHFPAQPLPRSACLGCPFHSNEEWQHLKYLSNPEFQNAVDFERDIQAASQAASQAKHRLIGTPYLHSSRKPLSTVNFASTDEKNNQIELWGNECSGMCGV